MRILTLLTLMAAVYFVARGDQHAGCACVIAADGRVWNNVRMDWTIAGDLQLSSATGHRITTLPEKTTSYSYTSDSWYLGVFAWIFIVAAIGLRDLQNRRFGSTAGPEVKDRLGELKFIIRWNVDPPCR
jgi:hypothetical protein